MEEDEIFDRNIIPKSEETMCTLTVIENGGLIRGNIFLNYGEELGLTI